MSYNKAKDYCQTMIYKSKSDRKSINRIESCKVDCLTSEELEEVEKAIDKFQNIRKEYIENFIIDVSWQDKFTADDVDWMFN